MSKLMKGLVDRKAQGPTIASTDGNLFKTLHVQWVRNSILTCILKGYVAFLAKQEFLIHPSTEY